MTIKEKFEKYCIKCLAPCPAKGQKKMTCLWEWLEENYILKNEIKKILEKKDERKN